MTKGTLQGTMFLWCNLSSSCFSEPYEAKMVIFILQVLLVGPALGYTSSLWQSWVYNSDGLSSGTHMHIISSQVPAFATCV